MKEDKQDMVIMPKSIAVKPFLLTDLHKMQRVLFATSKLTEPENRFHHFYDSVHVDEKWFFISEKQLRVYCAPDELIPEQTAQNRDHLVKVMFLCAVAHPRFSAGNCTFDGKIGMWPFVEHAVALRRSVNCSMGDIVTRIVNCYKARTYQRFIVDKVIPAIQMKWPDRGMLRRIVIQHNGALSHISYNDEALGRAARQGVWNISLQTQPAKSPDRNVLDLLFFRAALQAKQWSLGSETTMDGLIAQVLQAFRDFDPSKIDCGFLTLQTCLNDMMEAHGGNDFKIRHLGKHLILRQHGELP